SRQNTILFRNNSSGGPLVRLNAGVAGRIAGGAIFQQRVLDHGSEPSAVPVHFRVLCWAGCPRPPRVDCHPDTERSEGGRIYAVQELYIPPRLEAGQDDIVQLAVQFFKLVLGPLL